MQSTHRETNFQNLPIDVIEISTDHGRASYREDNDALLISIRQVGLLIPLVVTPISNSGQYRVVDGARRLHCLRYLGVDTVACSVCPEMSEGEATEMALVLNSKRIR
jgi:ParB/RepB/Spo0J family partition protein